MRITVRPATTADVQVARSDFPDLLVDRWRQGANRRSLVAIAADGRVLGHCRGTDNKVHPGTRVLTLDVVPTSGTAGIERAAVEDALIDAQIQVSTAVLHLKIGAGQPAMQNLARRHGGVPIQAMPPWRYVIGPELRAWATVHRSTRTDATARAIAAHERDQVLDLESRHHADQHAQWNPSLPAEELRVHLAPDHEAASASAYDAERSRALVRDGRVVAAALLWPQDDGTAWTAGDGSTTGGREVTLLTDPYDDGAASSEGPESPHAREPTARLRADKAAVLAGMIDTCADGESLLIDSHLSERGEQAFMADLPGRVDDLGTWTAIVAIPVPGAPAPIPLNAALIPEEAAWIRGLCAPAAVCR